MYLQRWTLRGFRALGIHAAHRPWTFVLVPLAVGMIIIALALGKVALTRRIHLLEDINELYTPHNGVVQQDLRKIDSLFPVNTSNEFEISLLKSWGVSTGVLIKSKNGESILSKKIFTEIIELDQYIQKVTVEWRGETYNFSKLCISDHYGKCVIPGFRFIRKRINDIEAGQYRLPYPFYLNIGKGQFEIFGPILGGLTLDKSGFVRAAKSLFILYYVDYMGKGEPSSLWVEAFIAAMERWKANQPHNSSIEVNFLTSQSIQKEFRKNMLSIFPFLIPCGVMMILFGWISCGMDDWVNGKPWLGVLGCLGALHSMAVAFSICFLFDIAYVEINIFITFLILGIGMDDTFMLITSWRQTDPSATIEERMVDCFSHVGVSITITSLTNLVAFITGTITPFLAVYYFCIYISVTIVICFIYQITLFAGLMTLFARLEMNRKHSIFIFMKVVPEEEARDRSRLYRLLFTGGPDEKLKNGHASTKIHQFFREYVGNMLSKRWCKVCICAIYLVYLALALCGITQIQEDFQFENLVRTDSYSFKGFKSFEDNFKQYKYLIEVVKNDTVDYSDLSVQKETEDMIAKLEAVPNMARSDFTWSWLKAFKDFQNNHRAKPLLENFNLTKKEDFIACLRNVFFKYPIGKLFSKDIQFTENYTDISATRYFVIIKEVKTRQDAKEVFLKLQDVKKSVNFPIAMYNQIFHLLEQLAIIKVCLFQAISLAACIVVITVFLLAPSISCALSVAFSVLSIEIGVLGAMSYFNINLDVIVMITLVMCIGLSVDYVVHVAYVYNEYESKFSEDKIKHALQHAGFPIVQSSVSTFLGIAVLFFESSYLFYSSNKTIVMLIVFAALHALFIIPTIFSIIPEIFRARKTFKLPVA